VYRSSQGLRALRKASNRVGAGRLGQFVGLSIDLFGKVSFSGVRSSRLRSAEETTENLQSELVRMLPSESHMIDSECKYPEFWGPKESSTSAVPSPRKVLACFASLSHWTGIGVAIGNCPPKAFKVFFPCEKSLPARKSPICDRKRRICRIPTRQIGELFAPHRTDCGLCFSVKGAGSWGIRARMRRVIASASSDAFVLEGQ
jgi:hypothetical protein